MSAFVVVIGHGPDLEAEEGAEQVVPVLAMALGIAAAAAVTDAEVEIAVGAEDDVPAVVIVVGLPDGEPDDGACRVGAIGIAGHLVGCEDVVSRQVGVAVSTPGVTPRRPRFDPSTVA